MLNLKEGLRGSPLMLNLLGAFQGKESNASLSRFQNLSDELVKLNDHGIVFEGEYFPILVLGVMDLFAYRQMLNQQSAFLETTSESPALVQLPKSCFLLCALHIELANNYISYIERPETNKDRPVDDQ